MGNQDYVKKWIIPHEEISMLMKKRLEDGMALPIVLMMIVAISWFTTQLVRNGIEMNKEMSSLLFYLEQRFQAEKKIRELSLKLQNKMDAASILPVLGFVPDDLEYGCEQGIYVVKHEADFLETCWVFRLY